MKLPDVLSIQDQIKAIEKGAVPEDIGTSAYAAKILMHNEKVAAQLTIALSKKYRDIPGFSCSAYEIYEDYKVFLDKLNKDE